MRSEGVRRILSRLILGGLFVLLSSSGVLAQVTVNYVGIVTRDDLIDRFDTDPNIPDKSAVRSIQGTINGHAIRFDLDAGDNATVTVDQAQYLRTVLADIRALPAQDRFEALLKVAFSGRGDVVLFYQALGISIAAAVFVPGSPIYGPNALASRIFTDVVSPSAESRAAAEERRRAGGGAVNLRSWISNLSYERASMDGSQGNFTDSDSGNIAALSMGFAWDISDFSVGFLVPYDHLDFDSFQSDRLGLTPYVQYNRPIVGDLRATFSANAGYLATILYASQDDIYQAFGNYGGGAGAALSFDHGWLLSSAAFSYQYAKEHYIRATFGTGGFDDDQTHLLKLGGSVGARFLEGARIAVFAIGSLDVTGSRAFETDTEWADIGVRLSWTLGSWALRGGYKSVVGLDGFESHLIFVGSLLRF